MTWQELVAAIHAPEVQAAVERYEDDEGEQVEAQPQQAEMELTA